ncbi:SDR family NAD(P)-dependent oxidoreductase [Bremerella alba]|uniref:3-oxoacyl-[acyl-carrier-protein] reductase FabG n=1 Tax=Bremerella alba TaxID=980252 RepID=A0A7V9A611_9BACT|nr:SDR family oxidoreductase [Bremerella alba]MBA2113777.1 3-oxoacyl-[acyl-carrier-protein] reductase FabG [Bremerella alba]
MPVAIVIGATGGIGAAIARLLASRGYRLLLVSHSEEKLQAFAGELDVQYFTADATQFDEVEAAAKHAQDLFGHVDSIVNCVGSLILKPAHLTSQKELNSTISLNLNTAFAAIRAANAVLRDSGGSVVLFSSAAARVGLANHEAIAAAKGAIEGLVKSAAATYAGKKIRVNAIAPGLIETPLTEAIWSRPRSAEASKAMHPLGRLGKPEDCASLACWLVDPQNSWITGQIIGVDGGLATLKTS